MPRSTYKLEYGRHVVRRRRRRRAYALTSNTAGHDYHEKSNSRVSISMGLCLAALRPAGALLSTHLFSQPQTNVSFKQIKV